MVVPVDFLMKTLCRVMHRRQPTCKTRQLRSYPFHVLGHVCFVDFIAFHHISQTHISQWKYERIIFSMAVCGDQPYDMWMIQLVKVHAGLKFGLECSTTVTRLQLLKCKCMAVT